MKMDFRKLLKLMNTKFSESTHPNLIWKVCVVNEATRRIRIYNNYIDIVYVYEFEDGVHGKFYQRNVRTNTIGCDERTEKAITALAGYAADYVDDRINELVIVSPSHIQILD